MAFNWITSGTGITGVSDDAAVNDKAIGLQGVASAVVSKGWESNTLKIVTTNYDDLENDQEIFLGAGDTINGAAPTDINDAVVKMQALIDASVGGGGGGTVDTVARTAATTADGKADANALDITNLENEQTTQDAAIALNTAKNDYPTADATKLATIEPNAKDDQTASEVPVDANGYAAVGSENAMGINQNDDTVKKVLDKVEAYGTALERRILETVTISSTRSFAGTPNLQSGTFIDAAGNDYDSNDFILLSDSENSIEQRTVLTGLSFPSSSGTRTLVFQYKGNTQRQGFSGFRVTLRQRFTFIGGIKARFFDGSTVTKNYSGFTSQTPSGNDGDVYQAVYDLDETGDFDFLTTVLTQPSGVDAANDFDTNVDYVDGDNVAFILTTPSTATNGDYVTADEVTIPPNTRVVLRYENDRTAAQSVAVIADDAATVAEILLMNYVGLPVTPAVTTETPTPVTIVTGNATDVSGVSGATFVYNKADPATNEASIDGVSYYDTIAGFRFVKVDLHIDQDDEMVFEIGAAIMPTGGEVIDAWSSKIEGSNQGANINVGRGAAANRFEVNRINTINSDSQFSVWVKITNPDALANVPNLLRRTAASVGDMQALAALEFMLVNIEGTNTNYEFKPTAKLTTEEDADAANLADNAGTGKWVLQATQTTQTTQTTPIADAVSLSFSPSGFGFSPTFQVSESGDFLGFGQMNVDGGAGDLTVQSSIFIVDADNGDAAVAVLPAIGRLRDGLSHNLVVQSLKIALTAGVNYRYRGTNNSGAIDSINHISLTLLPLLENNTSYIQFENRVLALSEIDTNRVDENGKKIFRQGVRAAALGDATTTYVTLKNGAGGDMPLNYIDEVLKVDFVAAQSGNGNNYVGHRNADYGVADNGLVMAAFHAPTGDWTGYKGRWVVEYTKI